MRSILGLRVNNAIRDAHENYISCIKEYENEMIKWTSDVLRSINNFIFKCTN